MAGAVCVTADPGHPFPVTQEDTMAKQKAAAKQTAKLERATLPERDSATGRPREDGMEQQIAADDGSGPEPHEINDNLASDRMRALLEDHRRMGSRP